MFSGSKKKGEEGVEVTWDNPEELENYIQKLQKAANRLTTENRKLRKQHLNICDKVSQLVTQLKDDIHMIIVCPFLYPSGKLKFRKKNICNKVIVANLEKKDPSLQNQQLQKVICPSERLLCHYC